MLYPLKFEPVLKDYIWGGRNLETKLGRAIPSEGIIAESWEIAGHKDGTTQVKNGPLAGTLLTDLLEANGVDLVGSRSQWALDRGKFPLLIKILDANRELSVQVHPEDDYALANEGNELGKTEMWVVLHAEPNAEVILGVADGTTPEAFKAGIESGALEPYLHRIPVESGDHINVPAGSLHAILNGLLIAEIQQNSNTTYRVYDWNRLGKDGNPRPLHVEKALDVINFDQIEPGGSVVSDSIEANGVLREVLNKTTYFTVERVTLEAGVPFSGRCDGSTMEIWGCIDGNGTVSSDADPETLNAVEFILLPAALGEFTISSDEPATFLRAYVE